RIVEGNVTLLTSWPLEYGRLQGARNAWNASPFELNSTSKFSHVLTPLRQFLLTAPPNGNISVISTSLRLPEADAFEIPASHYLPLHGTFQKTEIADFGGNSPHEGLMVFARTIPVRIQSVENGSVQYTYDLPDGTRFEVPRTHDLFVVFSALSNGTGLFHLEAPNGTFESLGCRPVPGTEIPPGYYVVDRQSADRLAVRWYADSLDARLDARTVTLEAAFLD
ncbi:MAG: hypothetical protein ACYDCK_09595, partial [Thermoplasmatota archaeon]